MQPGTLGAPTAACAEGGIAVLPYPEVVELTILGSSGTYAARGSACTGYLVDAGGVKVWLDCGPGTLGRLADFLALEELAAVVVSHEHPDHCLELPILYNALRYHRSRSPLKVFGTAGTKQLIARIVKRPLEPVFDWRVVTSGDEVGIGDGRWSFDRTDHPPETLAVKAEADGRSLVFSSDTGPGWTGESFAEEVDVLLCEATFARGEDLARGGDLARDEDLAPGGDFASGGDLACGGDLAPGGDLAADLARGSAKEGSEGRAGQVEVSAAPGEQERSRRPLPGERPAGTKHLVAAEAGSIARNCGAGRLMLTHLAPGSDRDAHLERAQACFDGAVEVVRDGVTYKV